ncbi:MAG: PilZ domain-containing protein [Deltaproteobacteria bacterium]|nr:PilZ domain-containing protein [Deltaproteobacteria bacterium]
MNRERRKHVRKRVSIPAIVCERGGPEKLGVLLDMSLGGGLLEVEPAPPYGTSLELQFELGGVAIVTTAVVRWSKPRGVGLQFGVFGARETYAITEALATAAPVPDSRQPSDE